MIGQMEQSFVNTQIIIKSMKDNSRDDVCFFHIREAKKCTVNYCQNLSQQILATSTARKVSKYGGFFGPYFPVFKLNTEIYGVNLYIQSEYRKIRTRKTSVFVEFSRSEGCCASRCSLMRKQGSNELRICDIRTADKKVVLFAFCQNIFLGLCFDNSDMLILFRRQIV